MGMLARNSELICAQPHVKGPPLQCKVYRFAIKSGECPLIGLPCRAHESSPGDEPQANQQEHTGQYGQQQAIGDPRREVTSDIDAG